MSPPSTPGDVEAEEECASSSGFVLAIVFLIVGLALGFLIGTRAKQLLAAIIVAPKAAATLAKTASAARQPPAPAAGDETTDMELLRPEEEEEAMGALVESFLNGNHAPGLDDHAQVQFNPIIMYRMKRVKEQQRIEREMKKRAESGEDSNPEDNSGDIVSYAKQSINVLIAAGARFSSLGNVNAAAQQQQERRRQLKSVEAYLAKQLEVDATRTTEPPEQQRRIGISVRKPTALQTALASSEPTSQVARFEHQIDQAKFARLQLKEAQRLNKVTYVFKDDEDDDEDGMDALRDDLRGQRISRIGRSVNAGDLALLQAEFSDVLEDVTPEDDDVDDDVE